MNTNDKEKYLLLLISLLRDFEHLNDIFLCEKEYITTFEEVQMTIRVNELTKM